MQDLQQRKLEYLTKKLASLPIEALIGHWNEYCYNCCTEDAIYENDAYFFEEQLCGISAYGVLQMCHYGNYRFFDKYVKFDGYGNLKSFDWADEEIDIDDLAQWFLDHEDEEEDVATLLEGFEEEI